MRICTIEQLSEGYHPISQYMDSDDLLLRIEYTENYPYSLIVEGEYSEFGNLLTWMKEQLGEHSIQDLYYGKTDYDFGFVEFFLNDQQQYEQLKAVIPKIYTTYPKAYPQAKILKSDGPKADIPYDPSDKNALVFS